MVLMVNTYLKFIQLLEVFITRKWPSLDQSLRQAEQATSIKKIVFIHAFMLANLAYFAVCHFGEMTRYVLIYFYPANNTLKALQSGNKSHCIQWLTYWVVFGYIQLVETISDYLFGFLPLYQFAKILLIIWCYAPIEKNGATVIYKQVLLPAIDMFQKNSLDDIGSKAIDELSETLKLQPTKLKKRINDKAPLSKTIEHSGKGDKVTVGKLNNKLKQLKQVAQVTNKATEFLTSDNDDTTNERMKTNK